MIALRGIRLRRGAFELAGVDLEIPTGECGALMGANGAGKTTLLEVICGLLRPTAGAVFVMDREVTTLRPAERGVGYVPQDRALFDTMSVADNLGFALRVRSCPECEVRRRVAELAALLEVEHLLTRAPVGLSGGEAQRVALGRALAVTPMVLCLDEPLANLDREGRAQMRTLLKHVQEQMRVTILHVTHDAAEAAVMGELCFHLQNGRLRASAGAAPGDA